MTFIVGLYSHYLHVLTMTKKKMALLVMMVYLVAQFSSTLQLQQQSNESFNVPEESTTTTPEEMSYVQHNSNISTSSLVNSTSTSPTRPTFNLVLLAILLLSGLFVLQLCCIGCMLYDILKVPRETTTSNNRNRNAVDVKKKKNESKTNHQGPVKSTLARPTPTSSTPQSLSPVRPLVVTGGSQASGLNSSGGSSIHDWQMSTGSTGSLTREISPTKSFVGAASSVASSNSNSKTSKKSTISANKSSNIKKK